MTRSSSARVALEQNRRAVDAALDRALPGAAAWPETIHRAVRYSLFAGGKRIRPLLVLAASDAVGGERCDAMPLACAVEMIHTYSLIHDDLPAMDNDDLRRGKPTSHKVFGEAIAILAGDALLTRAFHLLSELSPGEAVERLRRRLAASAILGEACGTTGLIGGQVMDLESEGRAIRPVELERLHRAKTGALLGACVRGGAILAGAGPEALAQLTRYADAVGLAFQIVDDVLDATEAGEQLGKTAGKDTRARKATYPSIVGLERSRKIAGELTAKAFAALKPFKGKAVALAALAEFLLRRDR